MSATRLRASDVRAAFIDHVDAALQALAGRQPLPDERVHAARKSLKHARAVLRLLRPALGERRFAAQNVALRDAGRLLSRLRDARAVDDALRRFVRRTGAAPSAYDTLRVALRAERDAAAAALATSSGTRDVRRVLLAARRSIASAPRPDARTLEQGLRRVYRRARRACVAARRAATPASLHEWRKRVKVHEGASTAITAALGRTRTSREIRELRRLARLLGDDHDAAVLAERARAADLRTADLDRLLAVLERHRRWIERRAFASGAALYRWKPSRYVRRVLPTRVGRATH
jgi:hypothetical protein